MSTELILLAGGVGITAIALGATIIASIKQGSFLYANARIAARSTYIITEEKLNQLISLGTLPELINHLKDTEYSTFLETIDKNDLSSFNMALEKGYIQAIIEIQEVTSKKFRNLYDIYFRLIEAKIIKTFFRSRFSNVGIDKPLIEPIGIINPVLLEHLRHTKTIADMHLVLRDTVYGKIFDREIISIEEFDFEMEKAVKQDIIDTVNKLKIYDKKALLEIFSKRREIKNILTLMKFRLRNTEKSKQQNIMSIVGIDVNKLIDAPDLKSFIALFDNTAYKNALSRGYEEFEQTGTFYGFERQLLKFYYEFVKNSELSHTIGPYPIISYITKKEIEQKNLLIIAKGIVSGLEKGELRRMLI